MLWAALINEYQSRTFGRFSLLKHELKDMKMQAHQPMKYFRRVDQLKTQIQDAANCKDYKLHELDLLEIAFGALPPEFDKIRTEMHRSKDITLAWLRQATVAAASAIKATPASDHAYYGNDGGHGRRGRDRGSKNRRGGDRVQVRGRDLGLVCTNQRCKNLRNHLYKDCYSEGGPRYNKKGRRDRRDWRNRRSGRSQANFACVSRGSYSSEPDSGSDYDYRHDVNPYTALIAVYDDCSSDEDAMPALVDDSSSSESECLSDYCPDDDDDRVPDDSDYEWCVFEHHGTDFAPEPTCSGRLEERGETARPGQAPHNNAQKLGLDSDGVSGRNCAFTPAATQCQSLASTAACAPTPPGLTTCSSPPPDNALHVGQPGRGAEADLRWIVDSGCTTY